jgi:hypothetical protein
MSTKAEFRRRVIIKKYNTVRNNLALVDLIYLGCAVLFGTIVGGKVMVALELQKFVNTTVQAQQPVSPLPEPQLNLKKDERVIVLEKYLESKESPLAPHAKLIIEEADKWDIGWTKIVSISGMESAYGKRIANESYNAWGIMAGAGKVRKFSSWEEGIKAVSSLLGEHYKANEIQAIKAKYCPSSDNCNPAWANNVVQFSRDILAMKGEL